MKIFRSLLLGVALAPWLRGQQFDNPVTVPVSYYGESFKTMLPTGTFSFGAEFGPDAITTASAAGAGFSFYSPMKQAALVPGKEYLVKVPFSGLNFVNIHFSLPANTSLYINGYKTRTLWGGGNGTTTTFRLRLETGADIVGSLAGHRAGDCTSFVEDKPIWYLSLGPLRNGRLAGALGIRAGGIADELFTTSALLCDTVADDEVTTERTNGYLTKVTSPEAVVTVDPYDANSTSYGIRVYAKSDLVNPYITYTISKQVITDGGGATIGAGIRIDRAEDAKIWSTLLKKVGDTWTLLDWRVVANASTALDTANPIVTVASEMAATVNYGAASGLTIKQKTFTTVNSQTELAGVTLGSGLTYAPTTSYSYCADSTGDDWSGALKSLAEPAGGWVKYDYYNTANSTVAGQVKRIYRPWLDEVADAASATTTNSQVETYTYTTNFDGTTSAPATLETTVKGTPVAKTTWEYNWTLSPNTNGHTIAQIVEHAHSAASDNLTTTTLAYREDNPQSFFWGKLHAVTRPNGSKDAYAYYTGTWDVAAQTFTAASGGADRLILAFHGQTTAGPSAAGVSLNAWSISSVSWSLDSLYLLPLRSTVSETVVDGAGHVVFVAENVFTHSAQTGSALERISATAFSFDTHNRLREKKDLVRATTESFLYEGDRLTTATAADGVVTKYTYDDYLRLQTTTEGDGGSTDYPAKIRTTEYDEANRPKKTYTCSCGTAAVTFLYDNAGRVEYEKEISPNPGEELVTSYVYPNATTTEITLPTHATRTESHYLDGRAKTVTGTAQPATSFSYAVNATGLAVTRADGDTSASTWSTTQSDWLGRTVQSTRPTWDWTSTSGKTVTVASTFDPATGELTKQTTADHTGTRLLPDQLFAHGYPGQVTAEGADLDGNGALDAATNDRFQTRDAFFAKDTSGWTAVATIAGYATLNDATATTLGQTTTRLTGFSSGQIAVTVATDANGRSTTTTATVSPAEKIRTLTVTADGVSNSATTTTVNGYLAESTTPSGERVKRVYDSYGRPYLVSSRWNGATYGATDLFTYWGQTDYLKKADVGGVEETSSYAWDTTAHTRTVTVTDAAGYVRYTLHNAMDLPVHIGGAAAQAVEFGYDSLGRRTSQKTWKTGPHDESAWPTSGAATTSWQLDPSTGLVAKKTYTDATHVDFTYTTLGQLKTRKWARGITTTYGYFDGSTGTSADVSHRTQELASISYDDGTTTGVSFTYRRSGNPDTVTDAAGTRTFGYAAAQPFRLAQETLGAFYGGKVRAIDVDSYGRVRGFKLGTASVPAADLSQLAAFAPATGLLGTISAASQGGTAHVFTYEYRPSSALVNKVYVGASATANFAASFDYDATSAARRAKFEGQWQGASVARFDLTYDNRGLLRTAKQSGSAYADYYSGLAYDSVFNAHAHNARGELVTTAMYRGAPPVDDATPATSDELPGRRFEYRYDGAGNRASSGYTGDAAAEDDAYVPDDLNLYASRANKFTRVLGSAAKAANVATLEARVAKVDRSFGLFLTPAYTSGPATGTVRLYIGLPGAGAGGGDLFATQDQTWKIPPRAQSFSHDADGNLTNDGVWECTYDAENRLIRMTTLLAARNAGFPNRTLEFQYDYMGRRIQKHATDAAAGTDATWRYVYDGWNLVAEYAVAGSTLTLARSHVWGLDVASSAGATGGVGALLQVTDHGAGKSYGVSFDGGGNVATLVDLANGALGATYEYSPYGETLRASGEFAAANPFRFSTKFTDVETGLVYYGHRYYSPALGRFISRDPIEEQGGLNLHAFCSNAPVDRIDVLGLDDKDETIKLPDYIVTADKSEFGLYDWLQQRAREHTANNVFGSPQLPFSARITTGTFTAPTMTNLGDQFVRCLELAKKIAATEKTLTEIANRGDISPDTKASVFDIIKGAKSVSSTVSGVIKGANFVYSQTGEFFPYSQTSRNYLKYDVTGQRVSSVLKYAQYAGIGVDSYSLGRSLYNGDYGSATVSAASLSLTATSMYAGSSLAVTQVGLLGGSGIGIPILAGKLAISALEAYAQGGLNSLDRSMIDLTHTLTALNVKRGIKELTSKKALYEKECNKR